MMTRWITSPILGRISTTPDGDVGADDWREGTQGVRYYETNETIFTLFVLMREEYDRRKGDIFFGPVTLA